MELTFSSGVDFDDPDYGIKEEDKDFEKVFNHNQGIRHLLTALYRRSMKQRSKLWWKTVTAFSERCSRQLKSWVPQGSRPRDLYLPIKDSLPLEILSSSSPLCVSMSKDIPGSWSADLLRQANTYNGPIYQMIRSAHSLPRP